jgi:hypothetical protein
MELLSYQLIRDRPASDFAPNWYSWPSENISSAYVSLTLNTSCLCVRTFCSTVEHSKLGALGLSTGQDDWYLLVATSPERTWPLMVLLHDPRVKTTGTIKWWLCFTLCSVPWHPVIHCGCHIHQHCDVAFTDTFNVNVFISVPLLIITRVSSDQLNVTK